MQSFALDDLRKALRIHFYTRFLFDLKTCRTCSSRVMDFHTSVRTSHQLYAKAWDSCAHGLEQFVAVWLAGFGSWVCRHARFFASLQPGLSSGPCLYAMRGWSLVLLPGTVCQNVSTPCSLALVWRGCTRRNWFQTGGLATGLTQESREIREETNVSCLAQNHQHTWRNRWRPCNCMQAWCMAWFWNLEVLLSFNYVVKWCRLQTQIFHKDAPRLFDKHQMTPVTSASSSLGGAFEHQQLESNWSLPADVHIAILFQR